MYFFTKFHSPLPYLKQRSNFIKVELKYFQSLLFIQIIFLEISFTYDLFKFDKLFKEFNILIKLVNRNHSEVKLHALTIFILL